MRWLRAKVEQDPEHPEHLLTVRGVGYQLELGVEGREPEAARALAQRRKARSAGLAARR